jgi:hypothetical protein
MKDEELRTLYAETMARPASRDGADCPSPEDLSALVEHTLPESQGLALLDHVMSCRSCQQEFELLRALRAAAPKQRWGWRPLALAASIVLIAGSGILWTTQYRGQPGGPVYRGEAAAFSLASPAADAVVTLPSPLVWQALPGAGRYHVELVDSSGSLVFSVSAADTLVFLPADGTVAAGTYSWYVIATLADGTEIRTPPRHLQIRIR